MTLVHEKRGAALSDDAPRKEASAYPYVPVNSIVPGEQRIPWSERVLVTLNVWQLIPFVLGHAAIVLSVLGIVWGDHGA